MMDKDLDLSGLEPNRSKTKTLRLWIDKVMMAGINEGYDFDTIGTWIKEYGEKKGYSRFQIYRELKRNHLISYKRYHNVTIAICDKCQHFGNLHFYRDHGKNTKYYVQHWRIGTWPNTGAPKYKRCYQKPERYEYLDKEVAFVENRHREWYEEWQQQQRTKLLQMYKLLGKIGPIDQDD